MVYLGIVASYQQFELQTFEHRHKAALHNRQRLLQVLHSRCLPRKLRVRLYVACICSTLQYGLHAVGIPVEVLRRLEAFDARMLRGIARSPAHMTHETSSHLRQRLGVHSPPDALLRLLRGRILFGVVIRTDSDSRQWFLQVRDKLLGIRADVESGTFVSERESSGVFLVRFVVRSS